MVPLCPAARLRRTLLVLLLATAGPAAAAQADAEPLPELLQELLARNPGPASLEGLCVLPETHAAFVAAVPAAAQAPPCDSAAAITPAQREAVLQHVEKTLRGLEPRAQRAFLSRLGSWITAAQQLTIAERLSSAEEVMGAAYAVPRTRPLFRAALAARGRAPAGVPPLELGATLSAAEHAALRRAIATRISTLPRARQLAYYRDLLDALAALQRTADAPAPAPLCAPAHKAGEPGAQ